MRTALSDLSPLRVRFGSWRRPGNRDEIRIEVVRPELMVVVNRNGGLRSGFDDDTYLRRRKVLV